ncbi:MAG: NADH-quinone oxidoreductase subunit C [Deltaproteobacteria bacterium]|nr:NADH-quinone oxidoreductase subunit C [Deltaproteobacteria bacterium]
MTRHAPMPDDVLALFRTRLGLEEVPPEGPFVPPETLPDIVAALKEMGFLLFLYCAATHWPATENRPEAFTVAYGLRRPGPGSSTARLRVRIPADGSIPTLSGLFAGADWQEREQYDLVGIHFEGHPDLRRLMLPEDWEGHPLRKDYAIDTHHFPWR